MSTYNKLQVPSLQFSTPPTERADDTLLMPQSGASYLSHAFIQSFTKFETGVGQSATLDCAAKMKGCLRLSVLLCCCAFLEGCRSFAIQPKTFMFNGHPIGYDVSWKVSQEDTSDPEDTHLHLSDSDKTKEPVLLLNGFGVGSFHQHRLVPRLLEEEEKQGRLVYCIDYLGK